MEGSRTPAVAKLTFLCYICHIFYSICCSLNKTSHQMLPWELSLKGEKVTEGNLGRSSAPQSHVVSITAPLDRGSKRAKMFENCLIMAKICGVEKVVVGAGRGDQLTKPIPLSIMWRRRCAQDRNHGI
ncbi:hypothetical protein D4764_06G0003720, partial [Takifugu flavidus]